MAGFSNPVVHVTMGDGAQWKAQTLNPDLLRYERTAVKHKWPTTATDAPIRWITFLAWSAGRREGAIPTSLSWERFSGEDEGASPAELCVQVGTDSAGDGVDPTPPGPDTG